MSSSIEFYEALRAHLPDEAAKMIADRLPETDKLATKSDIAELRSATKSDIEELRAATRSDIADLRAATKGDMEELRQQLELRLAEMRADVRGWMLAFFVPLWIGVYGTVAAVAISIIVR